MEERVLTASTTINVGDNREKTHLRARPSQGQKKSDKDVKSMEMTGELSRGYNTEQRKIKANNVSEKKRDKKVKCLLPNQWLF